MTQLNEIEVFRLTPEEGKYYQTTTWTHSTGRWPNIKYYSTNQLRYVGKFVRHVSEGYRDNANHWDIFDNNGVEEIVRYTYEGTTSFIQVNPKINSKLKEELIHVTYEPRVPSLQDLTKRQLSSEETRVAIELGFFLNKKLI
jgi:hypothetical protein